MFSCTCAHRSVMMRRGSDCSAAAALLLLKRQVAVRISSSPRNGIARAGGNAEHGDTRSNEGAPSRSIAGE